jgi:hypothetical protein
MDFEKYIRINPYIIHGLIEYFYQEACFIARSSEDKPPEILTTGKNILTQAITKEVEIYRYKMQSYWFRTFCYILMFENLKIVVGVS